MTYKITNAQQTINSMWANELFETVFVLETPSNFGWLYTLNFYFYSKTKFAYEPAWEFTSNQNHTNFIANVVVSVMLKTKK